MRKFESLIQERLQCYSEGAVVAPGSVKLGPDGKPLPPDVATAQSAQTASPSNTPVPATGTSQPGLTPAPSNTPVPATGTSQPGSTPAPPDASANQPTPNGAQPGSVPPTSEKVDPNTPANAVTPEQLGEIIKQSGIDPEVYRAALEKLGGGANA